MSNLDPEQYLSDADKEKLASGDYVLDPVFGVTYKDVETQLRLQDADRQAEAAQAASPVPQGGVAPVTTTQVGAPPAQNLTTTVKDPKNTP